MRNAFAGLALASVVFCGVTQAQNTQQPQPRQPTQPGQKQLSQQGGQMSAADQQIAALIYGCCHNEVEISKFAQTKLQSPAARAFAEKMVLHHTTDCESYQRWAGKAGDTALRPEGDAPAAGQRVVKTAGAEGQVAAQKPTTQRAGGLPDWNKIHEQMAQQCLENAKQELGRYQGSEFDQAFMGHQLGGHMKMQVELKVLRDHVSPELQQQIDKSLQIVQGHLQDARQVMEQLKDRPSERVSRKPEGK